jgi:hypothetical protein
MRSGHVTTQDAGIGRILKVVSPTFPELRSRIILNSEIAASFEGEKIAVQPAGRTKPEFALAPIAKGSQRSCLPNRPVRRQALELMCSSVIVCRSQASESIYADRSVSDDCRRSPRNFKKRGKPMSLEPSVTCEYHEDDGCRGRHHAFRRLVRSYRGRGSRDSATTMLLAGPNARSAFR